MSTFIQAASLERIVTVFTGMQLQAASKNIVLKCSAVVNGSILHSVGPVYTRQHVAEFSEI